MHKATPIILLEIILLLGAWDSVSLQAQEPMLFGTWEQPCDCEKGTYVDRLRLEEDGTFSWTSTFTGNLDALMGGGGEGAAKEETDGGGYTFIYGDGTFATTLTGSYEVEGDRLMLTGSLAEIRINEESLEVFSIGIGEQFVAQYSAAEGRVLTMEEKEALVVLFVGEFMRVMEGEMQETSRQVFRFFWDGDRLVLLNEEGQGRAWHRVQEGTGVSAASWGQVKAWMR